MRLHRFYVSQLLGEDVVISNVSLVRQWVNVFKYKIGDLVILFNGSGDDVSYSFTFLNKKECSLRKVSSLSLPLPSKKVRLFFSIIKNDNVSLVTQKATELGVTEIIPILTDRSEKKNVNLERLEKIAIEASEQSIRTTVPKVSEVMTLRQAFETTNKTDFTFICNMGGQHWNSKKAQDEIKSSSIINIFIGPEGGWSPNEIEFFKDKEVAVISLGETVLRAETAAISACFVAQS